MGNMPIGSKMTISYTPPPLWNCHHEWVNVGVSHKRLSSTNTRYHIPKDAPLIQERKCLKCHGVEFIIVEEIEDEDI